MARLRVQYSVARLRVQYSEARLGYQYSEARLGYQYSEARYSGARYPVQGAVPTTRHQYPLPGHHHPPLYTGMAWPSRTLVMTGLVKNDVLSQRVGKAGYGFWPLCIFRG